MYYGIFQDYDGTDVFGPCDNRNDVIKHLQEKAEICEYDYCTLLLVEGKITPMEIVKAIKLQESKDKYSFVTSLVESLTHTKEHSNV